MPQWARELPMLEPMTLDTTGALTLKDLLDGETDPRMRAELLAWAGKADDEAGRRVKV